MVGRWWVIRSGRGPELLERKAQGSELQMEIDFESKRLRLRLKCDGTRAETRFRLSAKQTSPFKSARDVSSVD
jgi:hypothetical protein